MKSLAMRGTESSRVAPVALHVALWGLFAILRSVLVVPPGADEQRVAFVVGGWSLTGVLVTSPLALLHVADRPWSYLAHVALVLPAAFVWFHWLTYLDVGGSTVLRTSMVLGTWSALYLGILSSRQLTESRRRVHVAEANAASARLRVLRHQLNPHALFNALVGIVGLIDEDTRRAKQMLRRLSRLLRHLTGDEDVVPLGKELDLVEQYLALQEMRFEDDLLVELDVEPAARSLQVPALAVLTLVENAVKHGRGEPRWVRVQASQRASELAIEVHNRGTLGHDHGTGLRNLTARLIERWPRASLDLSQRDGEVVVARLQLGASC